VQPGCPCSQPRRVSSPSGISASRLLCVLGPLETAHEGGVPRAMGWRGPPHRRRRWCCSPSQPPPPHANVVRTSLPGVGAPGYAAAARTALSGRTPRPADPHRAPALALAWNRPGFPRSRTSDGASRSSTGAIAAVVCRLASHCASSSSHSAASAPPRRSWDIGCQ
jgi:hypothetical protein